MATVEEMMRRFKDAPPTSRADRARDGGPHKMWYEDNEGNEIRNSNSNSNTNMREREPPNYAGKENRFSNVTDDDVPRSLDVLPTKQQRHYKSEYLDHLNKPTDYMTSSNKDKNLLSSLEIRGSQDSKLNNSKGGRGILGSSFDIEDLMQREIRSIEEEIKAKQTLNRNFTLGSFDFDKTRAPEKNNIDNNNNDALAFMALTSGNVLDACFGVTSATRRNADITPACHRVNDAKNLLEDRDLTSDSFRRTAVAAYCDAFQVIIVHNEKMNKLNCITRCFKSSKIRRQTEEDLRIAFSPLITAIEESR